MHTLASLNVSLNVNLHSAELFQLCNKVVMKGTLFSDVSRGQCVILQAFLVHYNVLGINGKYLFPQRPHNKVKETK